MYTHPLLYASVSRVLAFVLLGAATLKAVDWLGPMSDRGQQWLTMAVASVEFVLGVWLLLGVHARWARLVTLLCFLGFLNVAAWGLASQRESCGCLGRKISVRPWLALAVDSLAITGMLLCAPSAGAARFARGHGIVLGATVGVIALITAYPFVPGRASDSKSSVAAAAEPVGVDADGLAKVIEGLERNRAALQTVTFSTQETWTEKPVAAMTRYMVGSEEAKQAYLRGGDRVGRYKCDFAYREDEIRVDCRCLQTPNGDADASKHDMVLVGSKGKRVHYVPGLRQAFLTTMKTTVDEDDGRTLDLRCAGFRPPIKSIADWLRQHEVLVAGIVKAADGRSVFRVRVLEKHPNPDYVTATFEPELGYLPSRIIYWFYPSGGILRVTDIRYTRLANGRGWFPASIRTRSFIRDTTDNPDVAAGQNLTTEIQISNLNVDSRIPDDTFDPILPARTLLLGNLAPAGRVGDQPQRASGRFLSEPRQRIRPQAGATRLHAWVFWPIALALNGTALGLFLAYRKRFAL